MQTQNRLFDDLARVASGALNTLGGLREEIELRVKERIERMAADMELVTREEFDAVKAMAAKARGEQESLSRRVAELEAELGNLKSAGAPARKKAPARGKRAAKPKTAGASSQDDAPSGTPGSEAG